MKKKKLKLFEFIQNNPDWESLLKTYPYFINIKRKDNFIIFNYNQINSSFSEEIVRECRGIILEDIIFRPVCVPFFKFGNYGESYCPDIDWSTAEVQEKVDGSLIKLWNYKGEWKHSTNGMIDAKDAELSEFVTEFRTFDKLINIAIMNCCLNFDKLDKNSTHMFELISPYNKVVIYHPEINLRYLGSRNNITFEEYNAGIYIGIDMPKRYKFNTLEDCIAASKDLPFNEEGYVVVDNNWNRVKIKSPAYVMTHNLLTGPMTEDRIIDLIKVNEQDEFLIYYPEYIPKFNEVQDKIDNFINDIKSCINGISNTDFIARKDFAVYANKTKCPPLMFNWYDGKVESVKDWLFTCTSDKIYKYIN